MQEDLVEQLDAWHEEDEYENIVNAITEIPAEERDYVLVSHLGRALNNLERYSEAIEQFLTVAKEGEEDPLWHYRIGLAYYYLDQYEDALREFEMADKLDPEDEDTLEFLEDIRSKLASEEAESEEDSYDGPVEGAAEASADTAPAGLSVIAAVSDAPGADETGFWNDNEQALELYVSEPPTDERISAVEEKLVFKLPASYIAMMKEHNGGIPYNRYFPIGNSGEAYIEISGILGIGSEKKRSLCGEMGSRSVIEHGGYPEIGVVICDCPSDNGIVMLDYRESLNDGEPEVVYVDKSNNYQITKLAANFEAFVSGLVRAQTVPAAE